MSISAFDHRSLPASALTDEHVRPASWSRSPRPMTAAETDADASTDLRVVLATAAGALAAAGGLIHLVVIRDHLELAVTVAGFAVMATGQWAFALHVLTRPSRRVLLLGGAFHAVIVVLWGLSRTTGLAVIPGAAAAEPVGIADLVSTTFSLGVIGIVAISRALDQATKPVTIPHAAARRMTTVILVGALTLSVPAVLTPHDHDRHHSQDHDSHTSDAGVTDSHDQITPTASHDHGPDAPIP